MDGDGDAAPAPGAETDAPVLVAQVVASREERPVETNDPSGGGDGGGGRGKVGGAATAGKAFRKFSRATMSAAAAESRETPGSANAFAPEHTWSVRKPRVVGGSGGGKH